MQEQGRKGRKAERGVLTEVYTYETALKISMMPDVQAKALTGRGTAQMMAFDAAIRVVLLNMTDTHKANLTRIPRVDNTLRDWV